MVNPESCQTAGITVKAIPQGGAVVCHLLIKKSRLSEWKIRLIPVRRLPAAGFINQPQTTPEAMNDMDMGKRKMPRKRASPLSFWSSKMARPRPIIRHPTMNNTVNNAVFRTSITNRGSWLKRLIYCLGKQNLHRYRPVPGQQDGHRRAG